MASGGEFPGPESIDYKTITLQRQKVAVQGFLAQEQIYSAVDAEAYIDHMMHRMAVRLSTEMLAEKVFDDEVAIPWSGTVTRTLPGYRARLQWSPLALALVAAVAALPARSLPLGLCACVIALLGIILVAINPPRLEEEQELPIQGKVIVPVTYWRKFPKATIRYPDSLGPYVNMMEQLPPTFSDYLGEQDGPA